jgi:2-polyprenyl-6-methoxyphenol hydroxylase-like FAD-dependent oxidoreductase
MDCNYAVIGGGLVGLIAAQACAQQGNKVVVFQDSFQKTLGQERALGLTYGSVRRLKELGFLLPMNDGRIDHLFLQYEKNLKKKISFTELNVPFLGINITYRSLLATLSEQLNPLIEIVHERVIDLDQKEHWLLKTEQGSQFQAPLLIAADGFHSLARKKYAPEFLYFYRYKQTALVLKIHQASLQRVTDAYQLSVKNILVAVLPLNADHFYVVLTGPTQQISDLQEQFHRESYDFLEKTLQRAALPFCAVECLGQSPSILSYHIVQQIHPRLILLGLAAKSFHPAAAMGLNQSIFEIALMAQLTKRYHTKTDFSWDKIFIDSVYSRAQQIRALTASLSFPWTRSLIQLLPLSIATRFGSLASFIA